VYIRLVPLKSSLNMILLQNMFVMIICDNMDEMDNNGHYDDDNELLKLQFEKLWVDYHVVAVGPGGDVNPNLLLDHRCLALSDTTDCDQAAGRQSRGLRAFVRCTTFIVATSYFSLRVCPAA
jgi:hypothetical protein